MKVIRHIKELQDTLNPFRLKGDRIGFVPTMGALHDGHLSLVRNSIQQNKITVVSIYVNPTQFNNQNDLKNYPRDLQKDCRLLESVACDIIFVPDDNEMYPEVDTRVFDFGILSSSMEGEHRPGHFNGVAKILTKLFDAVKPDRAYFGQKDFQQLAVVRKLVKDYNYPITIVGCPIVRERDGLAMSSRNLLLTPEYRSAAPIIYQTLTAARKLFNIKNSKEIETFIINSIHSNPLLKVEYCQIVDSVTLQPVNSIMPDKAVTICIAVFAGSVRLIDNIEIIS